MKRIAIAAAAALLMLGTAQAQQRSPLYGELGYSFLDVDVRVPGGFNADPQAIRGIIGYDFHPNFAVEGMAAFGTTDDSDRGVEIKLRHSVGVFVKPKVEFGNIEAFGRLGWARSRVRASGAGVSFSDTDDDFAYGLGVNYRFNPRMYVGADWMRMFDKDGTRVNAFTISAGFRF